MMIDSFVELEEPEAAKPDSNGAVGWVVRGAGAFFSFMLNDIGKMQQSYILDTELSSGSTVFYRTVSIFPTLKLATRARMRYYVAHDKVEELLETVESEIMRFV